MNDSLYFYILYLVDRQKIWTDFEALILNIKNGKVENALEFLDHFLVTMILIFTQIRALLMRN